MKFTPLRSLLIFGLSLPIAFAALAEASTPSDPAHHMTAGHMGPEHMAAHLRNALQLRPDQEGALTTLLTTMKPAEGGPDAWRHGMGDKMELDEHLTTPEHLDRMLAHMDEMRAKLATHAAAIKTFYAQLSASQKKAFDTLAPMMMHHHMMGHEGMGHEGMEHGGMGEHPPG